MKTISVFLLLILSAVMAVSCGDRSSASLPEGSDVPLRYAYPRVAVPDTLYSRLQSGPLSFEVNSAATACASANDRGLDLFYPAYRGKIYLSVNDEMSAERLSSAIANRRQRFALNLAGAPAKSSVFVNDVGFVCELTYTDEAIVRCTRPSGDSRFCCAGDSSHTCRCNAPFALFEREELKYDSRWKKMCVFS